MLKVTVNVRTVPASAAWVPKTPTRHRRDNRAIAEQRRVHMVRCRFIWYSFHHTTRSRVNRVHQTLKVVGHCVRGRNEWNRRGCNAYWIEWISEVIRPRVGTTMALW